jgi:DNA-3-methyladenine glycosylase
MIASGPDHSMPFDVGRTDIRSMPPAMRNPEQGVEKGDRRHTVPLGRGFFARETLEVAKDLLGTFLVHEVDQGTRVGRVVETEAYVGPDDRGSHAHRGRTVRTAPMFGPPGHAYVYLIYGMHSCLNVVTESDGYPAAVLLRALEAVEGLPGPARGPALLCRAMGVDRRYSGVDITRPPLFFLAGDSPIGAEYIAAGPRIGIDYAGEWAPRPWRFWIADSSAVSRRPVGRVERR